jgi:hypothetical protein
VTINRFLTLPFQKTEFSRVVNGRDKGKIYGTCGVRQAHKYSDRTAGGLWMMTSDGLLFPPIVLLDSESVRMTLAAITQ